MTIGPVAPQIVVDPPPASSSAEVQPPKWKKILWVKQPYPDNYVDETFLSQLKRNSNVRQYSIWTLAYDSSVILEHLATVAIFATVFLGTYNRGWDPALISLGGIALTICGYILWDFYNADKRNRAMTIKSSLIILFALFALSPVLKSLTKSTSSDSIWSIACWLGLFNVIFYDYSFNPKKELNYMLSTNLALAAAIVLASRLDESVSVFWFVVFSIQIFGIVPSFSRWVRSLSQNLYLSFVFVLVIVSDTGLFVMGGMWALLVWMITQFAVTIVFPGWFLGLQKYKNEIQGPWDPAKPVIREAK